MPAAGASTKLDGEERERLLALSFANADLLFELNGKLEIAFAAGAIQHLTGRTQRSLSGLPFSALVEPRDRRIVEAALAELAPHARLLPLDTSLSGPSGSDIAVTLTGYRLGQDAPRFFVTARRRVRSAEELELRQRADKQSGLMTAPDFVAAVSAAPSHDAKMTMIELVGFDALVKRIDPAKLDEVMSEVGAILSAAVSQRGSAARLAPDKLGVFCDTGVDVEAVKQSIVELGREADPTGAGIDIAQWTLPVEGAGLEPEQISQVLRYAISRFAERGLKEFKPTSMNEVMQELVRETVSRTVSALRTISRGGIEIAYQPIVGMADRRVHHWEALSRPVESSSPSVMVQFAEEVGLVSEFDLMVCTKVIGALQKADALGLKPLVAINLSANSLENDVFLEAFDLLLKPYPLLRPQIMIEITETASLKDLEATENVVQHLRRGGHKICLDDFGVGAAGFRYVQSLSVDCLKIDGSYVTQAPANNRDVAIVRAIVHMCRELKISTVAEMIETNEQARLMAEAGVDFGQGYLFGKPNIAEDFAALGAKDRTRSSASVWR